MDEVKVVEDKFNTLFQRRTDGFDAGYKYALTNKL